MKPLNVGIIGCGAISERHLDLLQWFGGPVDRISGFYGSYDTIKKIRYVSF